LDIPSPGAGQILVKTEACGVCHTDLHAAHSDWPVKPALPFIPGHEAIGRVAVTGSGVTIVKEGDRVGVPWLYSACGHCEYCLTGWETVCAQAQFGGYTKNGGFAEYLLADPNYVAHVPAGLAPAEAAPLICAGITTYKGIKETEARPGEWIAISGVGGLGHLAIQYAKAMGLPPGEFPIPLFDVVANCITIRGSFFGTRQDMAEALTFVAAGKVRADIELQPLASINQIFDRLEHGDVPSRGPGIRALPGQPMGR
jgi:D-arabinose 1-dehydrogenase-like Zn-dependent alcohol dehydrogenase